jgi:hypothetical protein
MHPLPFEMAHQTRKKNAKNNLKIKGVPIGAPIYWRTGSAPNSSLRLSC